METFSNAFLGNTVNRRKAYDLALAVTLARDQSDLPFDHISHVFTSVCYEFELFDLSVVVAIKIKGGRADVQFVKSNNSEVFSANNKKPLKIKAPF